MNETFAKKIAQVAEENDIDLEIREYSGRSMYGKETWAIVSDFNDFLQAFALAIKDITQDQMSGNYDEEINMMPIDDIIADLNIRTDSMGRSATVFY